MSTTPLPDVVPPEDDTLSELYDTVLRGFMDSPSESSEYSPGGITESDIDSRRSTGYPTDDLQSFHRFSGHVPSPLTQTGPALPAPSVSHTTSPTPPVRRRPLPRPPTNSSPPIAQVPSSAPQPSVTQSNAQAGPSTSQAASSTAQQNASAPRPHLSRNVSRKISRHYLRPRSQQTESVSAEVIDDNGAGPSGSQEQQQYEEEVPTSPTSEFPDHYGAFLPGYFEDAREDPNASASLAYTPAIEEDLEPDYTAPPPESYEESITSNERYRSVDSGASVIERWNSTTEANAFISGDYSGMLRSNSKSSSQYQPDASTFISADYPMLQRPSGSYEYPRSYNESHYGDPPQEDSESQYRRTSNIVEVTVNPTKQRMNTGDSYNVGDHDDWAAGPSDLSRRNTNVIQQIANFDQRMHLELHAEEAEDFYDDDERRFINPALLSHLAVQLRDLVPRGTHVKGSIPYPRAFTGKDIVSTLNSIIQRGIQREHGVQPPDRRAALLVARSLQIMLFFYEVEWGARVLQDGVEDVYMFMDDPEGAPDGPIERAELPTGVVTILTKCYSASCDGIKKCYSYGCPRKGMQQLPSATEIPAGASREEWSKKVPREVLSSLSDSEINRQTIIHKLISKEEQYIEDLNIVESEFIKPLRTADPPVMTPILLDEFIEEVFGNILELLECNRRLLEVMYVRQREQHPIIQSVGDIFLDAATEFRLVYPTYVGHHPLAEKRMKEELEHNPEFRLFVEKCSRQLSARPGGGTRLNLDLKHYLNRPAEHLQKYPVLLEAVYSETEESNPDGDYLKEAIAAIQNLQNVAQLRTFQSAMGKGSTGKWEWHDLVSPEMRDRFTKEESKRQSVIFELIKGEMAYVRDLENIETMYVRPLRNAEPPIIPMDRLEQFLVDVFHNYNELHVHHRRLVDKLHEIQREEHPRIRSITEAVFDAALNFREAYMEYIPNYPIAAYRIDDEMASNPAFKAFVTNTVRHPDAHRLDMKNFINRPIPRLLRYELLLKEILSETPGYDDDRDSIPQVIDIIKTLGRETEPGVASSKQKVELWKYNSNLVFKSGEHVDMDLLNEQRSLVHTGRLLRQQDSGSGIDELFVMLFDNYLVMTQPREKDGVMKYNVCRRPVPLDLLTMVSFNENAVQRNTGLFRSLWSNGNVNDRQADVVSISSRSHDTNEARALFPFTIRHNGRLGASGQYLLYAESAPSRQEWKQKLDESKGLRKVVQESNKVFEIESLSVDTFLLPTLSTGPNSTVWHDGTLFTGKVTCSVPFNTPDGRGLVAIGCAEGVWIGYRHDSRSLRRVLHLKMVSQCAILEDFGLFLVLADKVLFAYHLEALVPTTPGSINAPQTPQKINGKDVHFFSVGVLHERTLVIYMKKRGSSSDSVFHVIEPVIDKINERPKASSGRLPILKRKTEWFRQYKDFSLPDAHDLVFLRESLAILCAKGFMIVTLDNTNSGVTIPLKDDPRFPYLARRCDNAKALGMFRSKEEEFLLCYNEFGLFVDKKGRPSRKTGIVEWEGTAERAALHAPYVLLFDIRFIEVRHLETGRLVQIIPGSEIRCVWDGRSRDGGAAAAAAEGSDDHMVQEPRVHAVMNMPDPPVQPGGRPTRGIMQHVFELFPTIPLYLPGSLSSPSTAPYYPVSFSPPRSPPLRAHHI